jgi:hypothetical protein
MTKHRVPVLASGLRRYEDPDQSANPQIRALVAELRALPADAVAPAPRAHFRAELRTQLVAVAPRIIAESTEEAPGTARETKTATPERAADPAPSRFFGRPLRLAGAVLTVCLLVLGGLVWQSQRAVPGDALYGLKRASEDVRLAFAGSDTARAKDYLGFAGTRVAEAQALVRRSLPSASGPVAGSRISASTARLVRSTLGSADSDVRSASRLLTGQAARSRSAAPLQIMRHWAPQQLRRLQQLRAMLPAGALRHRAASSAKVVHRAAGRALALSAAVHRGCLSRSGTDSFGAQPCTGAAGAHKNGTHRSGPPGNGARHPGRHSGPRGGGAGQGNPQPSTSGGPSHARNSHHPGPKSVPPPSLPSLPTLPSLPLPTSSVPLSVGSCGVSLPLGVTVGNCPSN